MDSYDDDQHLLGCVGHVINLAAQIGLKSLGSEAPERVDDFDRRGSKQLERGQDTDESGDIDDFEETFDPASLVHRIRKIVKAVRNSPEERMKFASIVKATSNIDLAETSAECLILDVKTRWNSTCMMLLRFFQLRRAVEIYLMGNENLRISCSLAETEWLALEDIIKLLKPLEQATRFMSKSKYVAVSSTLPIYSGLIKQIGEVPADIIDLDQPVLAMKKKLSQYFDQAKKKKVFSNAAFLDPRVKNTYAKEDKSRAYKLARQDFEDALKPFEAPHAEIHTDAGGADADESDWTSSIFKKRKISSTSAELKAYLQESLIGGKEDPLVYWKLKENVFPSLAAMARTYLSIPATSTPSERAFSMGRLVVHHTRSSLSADKLRALMCLNSWFHQKLVKP